MDRVFKPELYAEAGIDRYLRVELGGERPVGHLFALEDGQYVEIGTGPVVTVDRPFPVVLDLVAMDADEDG